MTRSHPAVVPPLPHSTVTAEQDRVARPTIDQLLASADGLVRLKGKWVEIDREKLAEALEHWQTVERRVHENGLTFFEGMRLLAGATLDRDKSGGLPEATRHSVEWRRIRTPRTGSPWPEHSSERFRGCFTYESIKWRSARGSETIR